MAAGGTTYRVSVSSQETEASEESAGGDISRGGRYVAFYSSGAHEPGDTNRVGDVYVRDRRAGTTYRVSVGAGGRQGNDGSFYAAISGNGRFVAFTSQASNLVPSDANGGTDDVFVRDTVLGVTTLVSRSSTGEEGDSYSFDPAISDDGRFVVFVSAATNLVTGDTNGALDVFVHDRSTGRTRRVSVSSAGRQARDDSGSPDISADGRFVVFQSGDSRLAPGDGDSVVDVYRHDLRTGRTAPVALEPDAGALDPSVSDDGRFVAYLRVPLDVDRNFEVVVRDMRSSSVVVASLGVSGRPGRFGSGLHGLSISGDGRYVAFESFSDDLTPGDRNQDSDIYVRDLSARTTTRASVPTSGAASSGGSWLPVISADGRHVLFGSFADNLVERDTNREYDAFVHDLP